MLTKSDLVAWRQCPRQLWLLHHNAAAAAPSDTTTWRRARDGNLVGAKAREQLGTGALWPQAEASREVSAVTARQQLAAEPTRVAVEFPMLHGGLYARADALIPANSGLTLQETKASTFPLKKDKLTPDGVDDHLIDDVAIQYWVAIGSGLAPTRAELNLLNGRWRYPGGGDYSGLFRPMDVTNEARARSEEVPRWLTEARDTLAGPMPATQTGKHCEKPHPCAFAAHCLALDPPGPEHPIALLPGIAGKNLARKLTASHGYTSILEPDPAELTGTESALYRRMQLAHRIGESILEPDSGAALRELPYPRYYFDFEGIDLPVPVWPGVRPYEQIPFQWSCHVEYADGHFEHREFLDLSGDDPSLPCIERLLEVIPPDGSEPIFVYYQTYEKGRLVELAERHPQHAAALNQYVARLVDLHPIVRDHYYHPDMRGSFSIKAVLPTIAPELDYGALSGVADGVAAQAAYLQAVFEPTTTAARKAQYRLELLKYCQLDTWAMVALAYHLLGKGKPPRTDL